MHTEYRWCLARPRPTRRCGPSSSPARAAASAPAPTPRRSTATSQAGGYDPGTPDELARPGYGVRAEYDHAFAFHFGMRLPVIAAVNGPAAGVGLVLACYCDVRFAAAGAKLTTSAGRLGLPAEYGLSWVLPRLVGIGHAADLLISSRVVEAEEAARMGLVNRVLPAGRAPPAPPSTTRRTSPRRSRRRRPAPPRRQLYADLHGDVGFAVARSEAPARADGARARLRRGRRRLARPAGARLAPRRGPMSEPAVAHTPEPSRADVAIGAFTDARSLGDRSRPTPRGGPRCPRCGAASSRELPELVRPRRVPPGLRVVRVARHLGWAVGRLGAARPPPGRLGLAGRHLPAAARWRPRRSAPPTSSSARSSPRARASSPRSWSASSSKCRDQVPPEPFAGGARGRRGRPRPAARGGLRLVRPPPARRRVDRPGPRGHAASPARRSWSRCSGPPVGRARPRRTCGSWPGWRRSSSAASRSPRWPTRRRWSSCSPRRSPRSSTSASRPRTCSTSPARFAELGPARLRRPPAPPRRSSPAGCS